MDGFDHILNWKLKVGSHTFPGRDGEPASTKRPSSRLVSPTNPSTVSTTCRPASPGRSAGWPCGSTTRRATRSGSAFFPSSQGWLVRTPKRSSGNERITSAAGSSGRSASMKDWRFSRALWPSDEGRSVGRSGREHPDERGRAGGRSTPPRFRRSPWQPCSRAGHGRRRRSKPFRSCRASSRMGEPERADLLRG